MSFDVVIPCYRGLAVLRPCVESVLAAPESMVARLIVVDDGSNEPQLLHFLTSLRRQERSVRLVLSEQNCGFVRAANLGLGASARDVVLLNSDTVVTPGAFEAMQTALEFASEVAAVSPLSNNAGLCSVPYIGVNNSASILKPQSWQLELLPAFTPMPSAHGFCMALKRSAIDQVGFFDPIFGRGYQEENDWCQRARSQGFVVGRANQGFVFHLGEASFGKERVRLDFLNRQRIAMRYPGFFAEMKAFEGTPEALLAANWVTGRHSQVGGSIA